MKDQEAISHPFAQQKLPAWQPLISTRMVVVIMLCIAIVCLPLGIGLLVTSYNIPEVESPSYEVCSYGRTFCPRISMTFTNLNFPDPPIYLYYKLENFFQNNRRYARSFSSQQLLGQTADPPSDCSPFDYFNSTAQQNYSLYPCGAQAFSLFNDTFKIYNATGSPVNMTKNGIAWVTDLEVKFNNPSNTTIGVRVIPDFKSPDFIVWMRMAALPTFRKLYGIIHEPMVGNYTFIIGNNFPVLQFEGKKSFVLQQSFWLGGPTPQLGYTYIFIGAICLGLGLIFGLKEFFSPRVVGNTLNLKWGQNDYQNIQRV